MAEQTNPVTRRFPVSGPVALMLRIAHGSVSVTAAEGVDEASVVIRPRSAKVDAAAITVDLSGRTLLVRAPRAGGVLDLPIFGRSGRDEVDVEVVVPAGSDIEVLTHTAPITVLGRCGEADVAFGAGGANFEQIDGDLRARFGSGSVRAVRVGGRVQVRTGAGDARLGEVVGAVTAGCGSGTVEIALAHAAVHTRTGAGSARIGAAHGDVDIVSGSGSVHIGVPAGVAARLDLSSGSGDVRSELPIESTPSTGRAITLRARTGSGRVRLFRAA
ncbi:MAG: DUF4097 family beta strand repeat-containing protein [Jatrophihabitans sp.]|uniref:DUF4097 family beta strand repeat-containing protein n=1 Tax=Jatrophihabitans sp. TaxID=1932789 RepID=UPI003F813142